MAAYSCQKSQRHHYPCIYLFQSITCQITKQIMHTLSHLTMQATPCRREVSSSRGAGRMQQGQILFAESILGNWMLCAEHESLKLSI